MKNARKYRARPKADHFSILRSAATFEQVRSGANQTDQKTFYAFFSLAKATFFERCFENWFEIGVQQSFGNIMSDSPIFLTETLSSGTEFQPENFFSRM